MNKTLYPIFTALAVCLSMAVLSQENRKLVLNNTTLDLPANAGDYFQHAEIGAGEMASDRYYRLLQFHKMPDPALHQTISKEGIELLEYLSNKTYIAALPTSFDLQKLASLNVRSILPISPDLKLSQALSNKEIPAWAKRKNRVEVILKYHKNLDHSAVESYCESDGIHILSTNGYNNFVRASIEEGRIGEIAALPYIAYLDLVPPPGTPDDLLGRSLHRANAIDVPFSAGRHYTGEGVGVLCRDDGTIGPHIDFAGRLNNSYTENPNAAGGTHGDGVSGIMAGAGNIDPKNKGMASGAELFVLDYEADFLDETMDLHYDKGVLVTNTSYSNGCNGGYTNITATVDQQLFDNSTLMHVFSAGNSNGQDCGYGAGDQWGNITGGHKQAKNCITTANLFANSELHETSSRGPAQDGRIKPDISANGADQVSTSHENTYQTFGGTSAAAPGIAGILAQLHQAYRQLHNGETANAALLKACLLNTANDLGNKGPDFKFGWGQVNALRAAMTLENGQYLHASVNPEQSNSHILTIPPGTAQARVMLYWADEEASPMASKVLVNDLNLTVKNAAGNIFEPWLLDPSPDPISLNTPAGKGTDHLNNVEQVAMDFPEPGDYEIEVSGFELPFGPHGYFIVWEFRTQEITVTHPFGGESFEPGNVLRIHWDTEVDPSTFTLSYSIDGGNNFEKITTLPGNTRMYDWPLPNQVTGQAVMRVEKDGTSFYGQNEVPFSIAPAPQNLQVVQACPDILRVKWDPVDLGPTAAPGYEVFLLGEKYMEPLGITTDTEFDIPTLGENPTLDHWIAVKTIAADGIRSERSVAVLYNNGLLDCTHKDDLEMLSIDTPGPGYLFGCGSFNVPVTITYKNNGLLPQNNIQVGYRLNGGTASIETVPGTLLPGQSKVYEFETPMDLSGSAEILLEAFTVLAGDVTYFNDTANVAFSVAVYPGAGEPIFYEENFEEQIFPPAYYAINNNDDGKTWEKREAIGSDGQTTRCIFMDNYFYSSVGEEDDFLVVPIDLSSASQPKLYFDVAYSQYSNNFSDGLRIEVSGDCGGTFNQVVYEKHGAELATVENQSSPFSPSSPAEWRKETINLEQFSGSSVVVKFTNITGYGNSLLIDNIRIEDATPVSAAFSVSQNEVCESQPLTFQNETEGAGLSYSWWFGDDATPSSSTAEGLVEVVFHQPGQHTVSLLGISNTDTSVFTQTINVLPKPVAGFDFAIEGLEVSFTQNSQFATSYFWDLGDGNFSIDSEPVHIYESPGFYKTMLTVANGCGTDATQEIEVEIILSDTNEYSTGISDFIAPNPAGGYFEVHVENNRKEVLEIAVVDVRGVVLLRKEVPLSQGRSTIPINGSGLKAGLYFVELQSGQRHDVLKLIIE